MTIVAFEKFLRKFGRMFENLDESQFQNKLENLKTLENILIILIKI